MTTGIKVFFLALMILGLWNLLNAVFRYLDEDPFWYRYWPSVLWGSWAGILYVLN